MCLRLLSSNGFSFAIRPGVHNGVHLDGWPGLRRSKVSLTKLELLAGVRHLNPVFTRRLAERNILFCHYHPQLVFARYPDGYAFQFSTTSDEYDTGDTFISHTQSAFGILETHHQVQKCSVPGITCLAALGYWRGISGAYLSITCLSIFTSVAMEVICLVGKRSPLPRGKLY